MEFLHHRVDRCFHRKMNVQTYCVVLHQEVLWRKDNVFAGAFYEIKASTCEQFVQ